jgi:hypothetical protein
MSHLWDRLSEAKSRLSPVQSKYRVLFENPNDLDAPASVLVPDPNWMAAALAGGVLPPVSAYGQVKFGCWLHSQAGTADYIKYSYTQTRLKILKSMDRPLSNQHSTSTMEDQILRVENDLENLKERISDKSAPMAVFTGTHEERRAAEWVQNNGGSSVAFYKVMDASALHDTPPIGPMTEEAALEYLVMKDISPAVWRDYQGNRTIMKIVPVELIPSDRSFRNAWKIKQEVDERIAA